MIEALFNQPGYLGAKRMLDATMARHDAIAANIANAETPRYQRVDLAPSFRAELQNAIAGRDTARLGSIRPQIAKDSLALPVNRDGNTVNLERELVELSQNTLEGTIQTRLVTSALTKLRMAITGKS
ncbi:MAG: flagellar basal body protein [Verrucomicrobiota bacterium]|jgi:flagellar basal-body rod protein FlgB